MDENAQESFSVVSFGDVYECFALWLQYGKDR